MIRHATRPTESARTAKPKPAQRKKQKGCNGIHIKGNGNIVGKGDVQIFVLPMLAGDAAAMDSSLDFIYKALERGKKFIPVPGE